MENCKICRNKSKLFLENKVLNKYNALHFRCENCNFIQTKDPYWLSEVYQDTIPALDTGLVSRNLKLSNMSEKIIKKHFNYNKKFIDYGGGYGLFTRLMRDKGFDFYWQDAYCKNLFAQYFDANNIKEKFELLTAFEVFEHLENPTDEIKKMLEFSDSILFSTELQPQNIENQKDWWYFSPESGQHISFYTKKSLELLAKKFNLNYYTNNKTLHLFTQKKLMSFETDSERLIYRIRNRLSKIISPQKNRSTNFESMTQKDHRHIKEMIKIITHI